MINLHESMLPTWWGWKLQPPDHQLDAHPNEPSRLANSVNKQWIININHSVTEKQEDNDGPLSLT